MIPFPALPALFSDGIFVFFTASLYHTISQNVRLCNFYSIAKARKSCKRQRSKTALPEFFSSGKSGFLVTVHSAVKHLLFRYVRK